MISLSGVIQHHIIDVLGACVYPFERNIHGSPEGSVVRLGNKQGIIVDGPVGIGNINIVLLSQILVYEYAPGHHILRKSCLHAVIIHHPHYGRIKGLIDRVCRKHGKVCRKTLFHILDQALGSPDIRIFPVLCLEIFHLL